MNKNIIALIAIPVLVFTGLNWKYFVKAYDSRHMLAMPMADLGCPETPTCVSSRGFGIHLVAPLDLGEKPLETIKKVYSELGIKVISREGDYLHAEATTPFYGFTDDVDLSLIANDDGLYDIRSASRIGAKDYGVNRQRVEKIRSLVYELVPPAKRALYNTSH